MFRKILNANGGAVQGFMRHNVKYRWMTTVSDVGYFEKRPPKILITGCIIFLIKFKNFIFG